ncbi:tetratricopeptide repeat protein [Flavobacterium sp.]|uniref:tetratricopeptide repeat protein n=1 Tax=Flavobacterium sp. TaxID=239 RepID=UPI0026066716|nr:tetratricopeptide repeat protein [Flavobacterium sp.]
MNKMRLFSIGLIALASGAFAQDIEQAKKAIEAEQFEKAKKMLKAAIAAKPDQGKAYLILGNVYLMQKIQDSAVATFKTGITVKTNPNFNYIGLGQVDLDNSNTSGALANFNKALEVARKKDYEELMYIGKAYTHSTNPDYKKALEYLNKAKEIAPTNPQVQLALGDALLGDKNVNEAFSAYRNAADTDPTLLRAKLQLGVLKKGSRAFNEAKADFDNILAANPNYGPAYRELAETYYVWALNDKPKYAEYNKKAIEYYEKYMSMTDYSLDSRMRHADFLVLTKDYKGLEAEASAMQKLDKVNPRILRYLGYSAYQNGNVDAAITALNDFFSKDKAKIIGRDYLYLGLAKTQKSLKTTPGADGKDTHTIEEPLFNAGIADIRKGVEMDPAMANELNDFGKKFFDLKLYREAAAIYEIATTNPKSRNFLYDNFYLGYALYFSNANKEEGQMDIPALKKADTAFANVIAESPNTQDAYIYKARVNSLIPNDPAAEAEMVKNYEEYVKVVTAKGAAEVAKESNKKKFIEAYNNIGIVYAKTDKVKAKEYFEKVLALDPADETALNTIKLLK